MDRYNLALISVLAGAVLAVVVTMSAVSLLASVQCPPAILPWSTAWTFIYAGLAGIATFLVIIEISGWIFFGTSGIRILVMMRKGGKA